MCVCVCGVWCVCGMCGVCGVCVRACACVCVHECKRVGGVTSNTDSVFMLGFITVLSLLTPTGPDYWNWAGPGLDILAGTAWLVVPVLPT